MSKRNLPPAEEIWRLYNKEQLSTRAIATKLNCSQATVIYKLKRAGYKLRNRSEAQRLAYVTGRHEITVQRGESHWLWKGGKSKCDYRKKVKKVKCEKCGGKLNLGIHHKDYDHYNNDPENLQVLCVSCHMSLHMRAYWAAVKAGQEPLKSNAPAGWHRKQSD